MTTSHRSYVANGVKHYWYNGQEWSLNLATGQRRRISADNAGPQF